MRDNSGRSRGQVGVGTLVIFVAMVLVAAVAAGVLINTVGFLQSESDAAGEEAAGELTDRLIVESETGSAIEGGSVGIVNLTVTTGPGTDAVDLRNVTMSILTPDGSFNLVAAGVESPTADGRFWIGPVRDADGTHPVLTTSDDRAVLSVDLGTDDLDGIEPVGERLDAGAVATIEMNTRAGGTTAVTLGVPPSLSGRDAVTL